MKHKLEMTIMAVFIIILLAYQAYDSGRAEDVVIPGVVFIITSFSLGMLWSSRNESS